jgi:hypothetical protein
MVKMQLSRLNRETVVGRKEMVSLSMSTEERRLWILASVPGLVKGGRR